MFADDFESGVEGWELEPSSAWSVVDDGGSKVLQGTGHVHAFQDANRDNVVWRMRLKIESGRTHLNFHVKDDRRYLIWFDPTWTQAMKLPADEPLAQTNTVHPTGEWHVVEISLLNGTLRIATDGIAEITYPDSTPLGPGGEAGRGL